MLTKCGVQGMIGCSIIRTSLTVALMVSLPRFGSLWAFGPSAHWAHASLRAHPPLAVPSAQPPLCEGVFRFSMSAAAMWRQSVNPT